MIRPPLVHINYQRTLLATKFHGIGRAILKSHATSDNNGTKPADAVVWLQKAFTMADQLDDSAVSGVPQLKVVYSPRYSVPTLTMLYQISMLRTLGLCFVPCILLRLSRLKKHMQQERISFRGRTTEQKQHLTNSSHP